LAAVDATVAVNRPFVVFWPSFATRLNGMGPAVVEAKTLIRHGPVTRLFWFHGLLAASMTWTPLMANRHVFVALLQEKLHDGCSTAELKFDLEAAVTAWEVPLAAAPDACPTAAMVARPTAAQTPSTEYLFMSCAPFL